MAKNWKGCLIFSRILEQHTRVYHRDKQQKSPAAFSRCVSSLSCSAAWFYGLKTIISWKSQKNYLSIFDAKSSYSQEKTPKQSLRRIWQQFHRRSPRSWSLKDGRFCFAPLKSCCCNISRTLTCTFCFTLFCIFQVHFIIKANLNTGRNKCQRKSKNEPALWCKINGRIFG